MKKKVWIIAVVLLLCMFLPGIVFAGETFGREEDSPYPVEGGNIYFNVETGTVTDCDESVTEAIIPSQINGVNVTSIDFSHWCFFGAMDEDWDNIKLTSITIPATVSKVSSSMRFPALTSIKIDPANPYLSVDNTVIFNKDKTELLSYLGCNLPSAYTVPNGVIKIQDMAFMENARLESITIPASVTSIPPYAFLGCENLKDVYYNGTKEQWDKINVISEKLNKKMNMPSEILNANIHYNNAKTSVNSSTTTTPVAKSDIKIVLNGSSLAFSEAPYVANGTTMVPMRVFFEALKTDVNYEAATKKITATKGDTVIELVLGQKAAKKNDQTINLDVAATTRNGSTMVPLRFVAEALKAQVDWNNASRTVTITLAE